MTVDARACYHQIKGLLRAAKTTEELMRDLGAVDPSVEVVIGVDQDVWDAFTDEDGPAKEYTTFRSRKLAANFEITAYKKEE